MRFLAAAICGVMVCWVAAIPAARADWTDNKINQIIDDVKNIKNQVTGDGPIKTVADNFKSQIDEAVDKGFLLKQSAGDVLTWLKSRRGPYKDFVYGIGVSGGTRCSSGTPCHNFRVDLINFFSDLAALRNNFPIIQRVGFGDGSHMIDIAQNVPPIILFALHETLGRIPDWQSLPSVLQDVYDKIDDPDVFSMSAFTLPTTQSVSTQGGSMSAAALSTRTPTQRFCDNHTWRIETQIDQVRVNRIQFVVFTLKDLLTIFQSGLNHTIGASIVGEGTDTVAPNPVTVTLQIVTVIFDVVEKAVETYRDNLDICRKNNSAIEAQVAQCIQYVNAVMPGSRDDIYSLVRAKIDAASLAHLETGLSEYWMGTADNQRAVSDYRDAFQSLCSAYQTIGSACNGSCQPNPGGGGKKN